MSSYSVVRHGPNNPAIRIPIRRSGSRLPRARVSVCSSVIARRIAPALIGRTANKAVTDDTQVLVTFGRIVAGKDANIAVGIIFIPLNNVRTLTQGNQVPVRIPQVEALPASSAASHAQPRGRHRCHGTLVAPCVPGDLSRSFSFALPAVG